MIKNCLHSKASYNVFQTNLFIQLAGSSRITIDKSKSIPVQDLKELEKHMLMNINEYLKMNLPHTMCSFIRLNYIPRDIIGEMIRTNKFDTFQGEGTYQLLKQIISSKLQSLDSIVEKLWDRLGATHEKAPSSRYFQILTLVSNYQKFLPTKQEQNIALMQKYLDACTQCIIQEGKNFTQKQSQELANAINIVN